MFVECRHILPRGTKCKGPALRNRPYCYFHDQLHTYTQDGMREDKGPLCLPSIEDASGIQLALMQVMGSMTSGRLDSRDGARLLYGLQVAIQTLDRVCATPPQEIVQATACDGIGIDIADQSADLCQPHAECPTCTKRYGCDNVARQNKKSFRHIVDEARDRRDRGEPEPSALPAPGADAPCTLHEIDPGEAILVPRDEPQVLAPCQIPEVPEGFEEDELLVCAMTAAPGPAPCSTASGPFPLTEPALDPEKEAALAKRIDKFRWRKPEPEISREELDRMVLENSRECDIRYRQQQQAQSPPE